MLSTASMSIPAKSLNDQAIAFLPSGVSTTRRSPLVNLILEELFIDLTNRKYGTIVYATRYLKNMKITVKQLKKLLENLDLEVLAEDHDEDYDMEDNGDDSEFFLHGYERGEPHDAEGNMAQYQLHRVKQMSQMMCDMLEGGDQLPAWVQDHLSVAHENLGQVFSYMEPKYHMESLADEDELEDEWEVEDDEEIEPEELGEGLWDNVWARRRAGKKPKKPGQKGFPSKKAWAAATKK